MRTIADQFGLSKTSLIRHKNHCLPDLLARAYEDPESKNNKFIKSILNQMMETLSRSLDATDRNGNPNHSTRLKAIGITLRIFGLLGT